MTTKDEENEFIRKILKIREHPEEALFPNEYALEGPPKGRVYEKQPFKFQVEAGKAYSFCTCGHNNSQVYFKLSVENLNRSNIFFENSI